MNELAINDIKPLVEIPDASFYLFITLLILLCVVLIGLLFLLFGFFKNRKKSERKEQYKYLKELDLTDAKKASYAITLYARKLARSPQEERLCNKLIEDLEQYKYKKSVSALNKESLNKFHIFMDELDV
ncbi:MAG: hypothetical protein ACNI3C_01015 [Candidatus Marinarcus sp.]|uniref:hypothetical protein n=1 Tax=Candidatus Marinarcus sp. TaxID=3100987 RepID=UPI003AFFD5B0